jgi:chromosome segregation ATPase
MTSEKVTELYALLEELTKKFEEVYRDLPLDQLYEMKKQIESLKEEIEREEEKEKYLKARLEEESERYSKQSDYRMASSMMREDVPARPIMKKRVVPVDDDGEPIQELGGGKWVRK